MNKSVLTRLQHHRTIGVMFRAPADRLQGLQPDPSLPIMSVDYRLAGIYKVQAASPPPVVSSPPAPVEPPTPRPVATPVQQTARTEPAPKPTFQPMDNPVMGAYKPPVPVTGNQLDAILNAHARKKESGEAYEKKLSQSPWLKELKRQNEEKERKARIRREARERRNQPIERERRRAVTYVEPGKAGAMPLLPPTTSGDSGEVDDPDFLDNLDGIETDRPLLHERPETDAVVQEVLAGLAAKKESDSTIPLVLPRRARPASES